MHLNRSCLFAFGLTALCLCITAPSESIDVRAGEDVFVAENESLTEDLALFGSSISVDGYVDSDVIAFSRSIHIAGIVNQDLLGGAETIEITGQVGDDMRVGARLVDVRGPVGDDAIACCQIFTLAETGRVGGEARVWCAKAVFSGDVAGNLRAGCQTAEIKGHVGGNLVVTAETIELSGSVDGAVELKAEKIVLLPASVINGPLKYTSINEIEIQPGAHIMGTVDWQKPEVEIQKKKAFQGMSAIVAFLKVAMFVAQIIVGLVLLAISRKQSALMANTLTSHPWKSLGTGIVFLIFLPVVALILICTLIGLPLALLALLVYLIIWYLSPIVVGLTIGGRMVGAFKEIKIGRMIGGLILGLFILRALSFVPVLGKFVQFVVLLFGVGAIVVSRKAADNEARGKDLV